MVLRLTTLINQLNQAINDDLICLSKLKNQPSYTDNVASICMSLGQKIDNELVPSLRMLANQLDDVSHIANFTNSAKESLLLSDNKLYEYQEFLQNTNFKLETRDGI